MSSAPISLEEDRDFWKSRALALESILLRAKEKLRFYREASTGEYVGDLEYTELVRRIDESLAQRS